jgi:hypothetical protein
MEHYTDGHTVRICVYNLLCIMCEDCIGVPTIVSLVV